MTTNAVSGSWWALCVASAFCVGCLTPPISSARTYVVSPDGDDNAAGNQRAPLRTISRAAALAEAGDVVLVKEGVYRERVAPRRGGEPGKPIVYRAAPGERVVVKGSVVWRPEWRRHSDGLYSATPSPELFDDKSPEYVDSHNPLEVELSSTPWGREGRREHERRIAGETRIGKTDARLVYTCGQLFVDGKPYREAPLRSELEPGCWWYNAAEQRVYAHFGSSSPDEHRIELTTRRRLFAPRRRGLGYIHVEGFLFEHCGNQYPTNFWKTDAYAQRGAVGAEAGHHWVFRRNLIRYAKTFALDIGRVDRHSRDEDAGNNFVEENYIVDNGSAGILSSGSRDLVIRGNVILRNNRLRFLGVKRWEQAGVKCHQFVNGRIESNYIAENYDTYGVWLDNQFPGCRVTGNVIHGNGRAGVFLEMSDYGYDTLLIDNNYVFGNHENAVYIHDASGATFRNNVLECSGGAEDYGQAVYLRQVTTRTSSGRHTFIGNLILSDRACVEVNYPSGRSGPQRFDYNVYGCGDDSDSFWINRRSDVPSPWSESGFTDIIREDLASEGAETLDALVPDDGRVGMPLRVWRRFWDRHGESNDARSVTDPGASLAYDDKTHELSLRVALGAPDLPDRGDAEARLRHGSPAVSPPATRSGDTRRKIWSGLPLISEGEIPDENWNRVPESPR